MKITRLFAILFAILSLALVLTLVGCQKDNGNQNVPGGNTSPACEHISTTVTSNCEKVCVTCGKVLETDLHRDHIVNFRCEEVCPVCDEVFKTGVHDEGVINDDCERICTRCGVLCETDVHADKVINDKCEEVCSRCDKVYATGIHDEGAYGENCDKACTRCGTTLATGEHGETVVNDKCEEVCVRCNKVMATGVHAEKIVNDKLQEVCSRCGEVYVECVHDAGVIENCVKSCGNCGEVLDAEAHGEKIVNDNCDEVCADCGKVYAADVHAEGIVGDDCVMYCSRCNDVMETEVHADKIINDKCEEVCSRCGKVYNTDMHEASVETYVDDYKTNVRTYTKGCARCGGNVEYSYTIQLGAKKPEVFVSAAQLAAIGMGDKFEKTVLSADGTYATFKSKAGQGGDANFYPYVGDGSASGQYIIIKYRTTLDTKWEMWTSAGTDKTGATGGENFYYTPVANGEWQYLVIDLAKTKPNHFKTEEGKYCIDFFRWDIFNSSTANSETVDVAYVAIADSLTELTVTCTDAETVQVVVGSDNKYYEVYAASGTPSGNGNAPAVVVPYYRYSIDFVNGNRGTGCGNGGGTRAPMIINDALSTQAGGNFSFSGWAAAYTLDITKYQYSADGGNTWLDFNISNCSKFSASARGDIFGVVQKDIPNLLVAGTEMKNGLFNLTADLSAYYGKTIDLSVSMLLSNGDRCVMANYTNVTVDDCSHYCTPAYRWDTTKLCYTKGGACDFCGTEFEDFNALHVSEPAHNQGLARFTSEQKDGFVRYTKTGDSDPYIHIYTNGSTVTGRYAIIKYRVNKAGLGYGNSFVGSIKGDHATASDGCDTNKSSTSSGSFTYNGEEWQYLIFEAKSTCFKPNEDGTYTYRFIRLGLSSLAVGDYIDIDEIAFVDNKYAADRYVIGDDAVCGHVDTTTVWNSESKLYVTTCVACGNVSTSDMLYKTEAATTDVGSLGNYLTATQKDGFVRYTAGKTTGGADPSDPYFYPFRGNTTNVTGQYMVIKYRVSNNGTNMTVSAPFASSAAKNQNSASGLNGDNQNTWVTSNTLYADGEWHYAVVTPDLVNNKTFIPNSDGTYTWQYLRMRLNGFAAYDGTYYIDIDEIAFADNLEAVENYVANN